MHYRTVKSIGRDDAAYIAGLVDGEGTVTLTRRHAGDMRQLVISIANTDRSLLQYVLEVVGAGKITSKRTVSSRHTPSYCFTVSNRQALALGSCIYPFLRTYKAQRMALALTYYVRLTPRNGKYTTATLQARRDFEHEFMRLSPKTGSS